MYYDIVKSTYDMHENKKIDSELIIGGFTDAEYHEAYDKLFWLIENVHLAYDGNIVKMYELEEHDDSGSLIDTSTYHAHRKENDNVL